MEQKKKKNLPGRPRKKDKVKVVSAYLKESEQAAINKKYGNITEALRAEVLPELVLCG